MKWIYRGSFYRRIQAALLLFLVIPLLCISGFSYIANRQANETNVRTGMRGIIGILANDISKTANDVMFTANQFTQSKNNGILDNLRKLEHLQSFDNFQHYQAYTFLNDSAALHIGKLSLVHVSAFYINQENYPIIGSIKREEIARLQTDERFRHMTETEAASGIAQWFRADKADGYAGVFGEPYYYFSKKSIYDPLRHEVLGTLFIGIPESYFSQLFEQSGGGIISLYNEDSQLIAGVEESPPRFDAVVAKDWIRETVDVPGTPWKLTYDLPKNMISGELTQRYSYLLMAVLIVMFVFLFMSIVFAKGLNRPIRKLMGIVKQYGEGNTLIRYAVNGQDEISVLGRSINNMLDNINSLIKKVETEQEEKRTIELYALYSQIQPHFLFNTLNSIKCNLALEGDRLHSQTIDSLMSLLRAHLRVNEPLPLEDECKLLAQYVSIMRMRNRLDIGFTVDLPEQFREIKVPRLLLQPLVENSIVHGMKRVITNPQICIKVHESEEGITIHVMDNGKGIGEEEAAALNEQLNSKTEVQGDKGVGLFNVMRRLKLSYGQHARFAVGPNVPEGFVCTLVIPAAAEYSGKEMQYAENNACG